MSFQSFWVPALVVLGLVLLAISFWLNSTAMRLLRLGEVSRSKSVEFYRNTVLQSSLLIVGIAISIFVFYAQQNIQDDQKAQQEVEEFVLRLSIRVERASEFVRLIAQYDPLLDEEGPYTSIFTGASMGAPISKMGVHLRSQIGRLFLIFRDIDPVGEIVLFQVSNDLEKSRSAGNSVSVDFAAGTADDEGQVKFAANRLSRNFKTLEGLIATQKTMSFNDKIDESRAIVLVAEIVEALDILRWRARRIVARNCALVATYLEKKQALATIRLNGSLEQRFERHDDWLKGNYSYLSALKIGTSTCLQRLNYDPAKVQEWRFVPMPPLKKKK